MKYTEEKKERQSEFKRARDTVAERKHQRENKKQKTEQKTSRLKISETEKAKKTCLNSTDVILLNIYMNMVIDEVKESRARQQS